MPFDNVPTWHVIRCIPGSVIIHFNAAVIESPIGFFFVLGADRNYIPLCVYFIHFFLLMKHVFYIAHTSWVFNSQFLLQIPLR